MILLVGYNNELGLNGYLKCPDQLMSKCFFSLLSHFVYRNRFPISMLFYIAQLACYELPLRPKSIGSPRLRRRRVDGLRKDFPLPEHPLPRCDFKLHHVQVP